MDSAPWSHFRIDFALLLLTKMKSALRGFSCAVLFSGILAGQTCGGSLGLHCPAGLCCSQWGYW